MKSLLLDNCSDEEIQTMDKETIRNRLMYGIVIKKVVRGIMNGSSEVEKEGSLSSSEE